MTSEDPDVLRRQIEDTRRALSEDVDALNEKVNPARVVDRRVTAAKSGLTRLRDKVMGSAPVTPSTARQQMSTLTGSVQDTTSSAVEGAQNIASSAAGAIQQAPQALTRQAEGNPLAAGVIAFGVGWLVSSLLPVSEKEKQLASHAETAVRENKDALLQPVKVATHELGEQLKPAAQQAVEQVTSAAKDATDTVQQKGQAAAQDVRTQAQQSKETVQTQATS